jgi:hypothetical protein
MGRHSAPEQGGAVAGFTSSREHQGRTWHRQCSPGEIRANCPCGVIPAGTWHWRVIEAGQTAAVCDRHRAESESQR